MIGKILISLAVIVAIFVIVVALRPSDFRVTRSALIAAPPSSVFSQINDLHNYAVWNPWGKIDPGMKTTFDGPQTGRGSILSWVGNSQVGTGSLTIAESRPNEFVGMRLDFLKPFPSTATAEFTLKPEGQQTAVTWSMSGRHTFIPKAIGLFMNLDKMIGGQFDKGLADLKSIVESSKR